MAPNLKRISLISQSLTNLQVVRPKDAVYQQRPTEDSESYWEWQAPVDLFSADHLTANLLKASQAAKGESVTNPSSDDYWAEESSSSQPLEEKDVVVLDSASYWAEATHATGCR